MTWFITDPKVVSLLQSIVSVAGSNYNIPYDSSHQPTNGSNMLADNLLQFKFPGGSKMSSIAEPSKVTSMGDAISGILTTIAPIMSSYAMILPILGVIKGIIEVLCALKNPYAIIRAVIRLFRKWIPAFITLFPQFAAILLVLDIIKILLSIAFFILTTIIPILQLIKHNINDFKELISSGGNQQAKDAEKAKLEALVLEILNKIGLLNILKPILDLLLMILRLGSGKPCGRKKKKKGINEDITGITTSIDSDESESTCCDDDVCPPVFRSPPKGQAIIAPILSVFPDAFPFFIWKISTVTGNSNLPDVAQYIHNFSQQLNSQLDEPISEPHSAGSSGGSNTFNVQIIGKRGRQTKTLPIVNIRGKDIIVIDPDIISMMGVVQYEIIPNWEPLIMYDIVGLGCHPDIANARDTLDKHFKDMETPAIEQYPELYTVFSSFDNLLLNLNSSINKLQNAIKEPDFYPPIDDIQDEAVAYLNDFISTMTGTMNSVLSKIANPLNSTLDVDKNLVKVISEDKAIISVTVRDYTGSLLMQYLPNGVGVDVKLFTTFGTISNQVLNSSTGIVTADITSLIPGTAIITAKVNGEYITEFVDDNVVTKELSVKFVSDAILPKRRLVAKQSASDNAHNTSGGSEREPGGK